MALDSAGLEKSEITVYYEPIGGKNAEGQLYMRLLPYVKVRPFDSVNGFTGNNEYIMPSAEAYQMQSAQQEPYRQVLESKSGGSFPAEDKKLGMQALHEFHNI